MELRQELCLPSEFQELEHNVVVIQEGLAFVLFDVKPNSLDHCEHSDDFVFGFALHVRWLFPRHVEVDAVEIHHVFGEPQLWHGALHIEPGIALDLFDMVQPAVRPLWSCIVFVEVGDGELQYFVKNISTLHTFCIRRTD